MQITHIEAGGLAGNIIPGELTLKFNIRYSTMHTASLLQQRIEALFSRFSQQHTIQWRLNGEPFLTAKGKLLESCIEIIKKECHQDPELSTSGGTSDGRFIAPYGVEVIELGPLNATIHQVNECVSEKDLNVLSTLYFSICERLITQ